MASKHIFRTELKSNKALFEINHDSNIVLIGSCFSDNIGNQLQKSLFNVSINPFGVIYNPVSIAQLFTDLDVLLNKKYICKKDGMFVSLNHHSQVCGTTEIDLMNTIKELHLSFNRQIKNTNFLFISLGTSWVYHHVINDHIVANCHKLSNSNFKHYLLDLEDIKQSIKKIENAVKALNPTCKIIYTISPVRHTKTGIIENNISKSLLRTAVYQTVENSRYFPAYEIMMDDLRDYRFYEADMIHPNSQAIDYIWDYFTDSYFNTKTQEQITKANKLYKLLNHREFNNDNSNKFEQKKLQLYSDLSDSLEISIDEIKTRIKKAKLIN